ncbi:MAG: hypothetical protein V4592_24080 [Bacteroidota bacterium]
MNYFNLLKKFLIMAILGTGFITETLGQSLPQIQNASVRAPANIKADGELKEWPNKNLSAYNLANRIYYVVANDDDNLYLTIRGSGAVPAFKILKEGVTFTVSHSVEKAKRAKDPQNISVTYPTSQEAVKVSSMMVPVFAAERLGRDTVKNKKELDSLTAAANARVEKTAKEIKVTGIKDIKDSILSVYNDKGIKAVLHFWKGEPIIELAIPLKYLDLSVTAPVRFSYQVKLSVPRLNGDFDIRDIQKGGVSAPVSISPDDAYRLTDTELWGEYILVGKKP